jgi:hypothetical protein
MIQTKARTPLALLLTLALLLSLLPAMTIPVAAAVDYEFWDLRNTDNITVNTLTGKVDGEDLTVTHYTGWYAEKHNSAQQKINIYVPETSTPDSAVLHIVNNSGWQSNNFPTNTISNNFNLSTAYSGQNPPNANALALSRGMILVSYGARSRADSPTLGEYLGHSPATMTDTKAALRFLRYNMQPGRLLYGAGDPDRAFVTGTSGGGALSVVLAASGNSPDYYESLYDIGAAGISKAGNNYAADPAYGDEYMGTIAYCPILDLPMADQAYEFTYNGSRSMRAPNANVNGAETALTVWAGRDDSDTVAWSGVTWNSSTHSLNGTLDGFFPVILENGDYVPAKWDDQEASDIKWVEDTNLTLTSTAIRITTSGGGGGGGGGGGQQPVTLETFYNTPALASNYVMTASSYLADEFTDYISLLGLKDENGQTLTATYAQPVAYDDGGTPYDDTLSGTTGGTFKTAMQTLLEKGINKAIAEWADTGAYVNNRPLSNADSVSGIEGNSWIAVTNGVATITDLDRFLTEVPSSALKMPPAFNGMGLDPQTSQNENNLWGAPGAAYGLGHEWAYDHASAAAKAMIPNYSAYGSYANYLKSSAGKSVALQMKMSSPIPYLVGAAKTPYLVTSGAESSDAADPAPYWYVRHGHADRDTSFAIGTLLYYSLLNNDAVDKDALNFNFAWKKAHSGNYDTLEAFAWLDEVLEAEDQKTAVAGGGSGGGGGGSVSQPPAAQPADSDEEQNSGAAAQTGGSSSGTSAESLPAALRSFPDSAQISSWAAPYLDKLVTDGIMTGRADGSLDPKGDISRAEFAKMITVAFSLQPTDNVTSFSDVRAGDWYKEYVDNAYSNGLINGIGGSVFAPNANISRQDLCVIAYRALLEANITLPEGLEPDFSDEDAIAEYAAAAIRVLYRLGIISGRSDGSFDPAASITREEAAKILAGVMEYAASHKNAAEDAA